MVTFLFTYINSKLGPVAFLFLLILQDQYIGSGAVLIKSHREIGYYNKADTLESSAILI
jgi:hypothetical protein